MREKPLKNVISVIIPTYNRLHTIPRAIDSIRNQSYPHWELIIVDDGSTDGTEDWIHHQQKDLISSGKMRYMRIDRGGVSRARNTGIERSRGEWLAFLDSDDEWLPEKLSMQIKHAQLNSQDLILHGEEIWFRHGRRVNSCKQHKKFGGRIFSNCVPLCLISPSTVMIHRSIFIEVGLFREDFPVCEDYELWLRMTSQFNVSFLEKPLIIKYGGHEDQLSRSFKAMDYWRTKALFPYLRNTNITDSEKRQVAQCLVSKASILLKGYEKHKNWKNYEEVQHFRALAQEFLDSPFLDTQSVLD